MDAVEKATLTQLANIEKKTGKSLDELAALLRSTGLTKHGELRDWAKKELSLGHGDANTLVLRSTAPPPSATPNDDIYTGAKAALRPIHDLLLTEITKFGDFEIAPKKGYVSLRRKKQFAMLGPATNTRFEVGLNLKGVPGTPRLEEQPPKGMCSHKVKLTTPAEVDAELLGWIQAAFNQA
jgi:hypothetical protein